MTTDYHDEFSSLDNKYKENDYRGVIRDSGGIIEAAIKDLYEEYFPKFAPSKQKVLIHYLETKYNGSPYTKLGLGQLYGLFTTQKVWSDISANDGVNNTQFKLLALDKLSHLITLRNDAVHNNYQAEESEASFALSYVRGFLQSFVLFEFSGEKKNTGLKSSLDTLLATEVLLGEVQLYDSLNEVLQEESIDSVDVTYFSDVIPGQRKQGESIQKYWSTIANSVNDSSITLRRVISLPSGSGKIRQQKSLWLLLYQFPKYYDKIIEGQVGLSMIEISKLNLPNVSADRPSIGVPLINLILLYSKKDPAVGHAWLFGSHDKQGSNQVYLHMAGKGGFTALRSMYDNLFFSGTQLTTNVAKELMSQATNSLDVTSDKFQQVVENKRVDFGLSDQDAQNAIAFWLSFAKAEKVDDKNYF